MRIRRIESGEVFEATVALSASHGRIMVLVDAEAISDLTGLQVIGATQKELEFLPWRWQRVVKLKP
jgi:hypothetical protein